MTRFRLWFNTLNTSSVFVLFLFFSFPGAGKGAHHPLDGARGMFHNTAPLLHPDAGHPVIRRPNGSLISGSGSGQTKYDQFTCERNRSGNFVVPPDHLVRE